MFGSGRAGLQGGGVAGPLVPNQRLLSQKSGTTRRGIQAQVVPIANDVN